MGSAESGPSVDKLFESGFLKATYANHPRLTNRNDLLNTMINRVAIIIQPLGAKSDGAQVARATFSTLLPSSFSLAVFSHAGLFVYGNGSNLYDGVFIEYGAYDEKREGDYNSQVHYFRGNNGLRFTSMNLYSISGYKYDCDVQNRMTIEELCTCLEYRHFSKKKYNVVAQNCQYFVRKSVKILGSRRINKADRVRTISKGIIPDRILEVLEENEENNNFEERIPIIGHFIGLIKLAVAD